MKQSTLDALAAKLIATTKDPVATFYVPWPGDVPQDNPLTQVVWSGGTWCIRTERTKAEYAKRPDTKARKRELDQRFLAEREARRVRPSQMRKFMLAD